MGQGILYLVSNRSLEKDKTMDRVFSRAIPYYLILCVAATLACYLIQAGAQ